MRCIFQLVSKEYGVRTEAFSCDRDELVQVLKEHHADLKAIEEDLVLCLAEYDSAGEITVSRAPLMRLSTWRNYFPEVSGNA